MAGVSGPAPDGERVFASDQAEKRPLMPSVFRGAVAGDAVAIYHALLTTPPSRRGGLRDLHLFTLEKDAAGAAIDGDGLLLVVVNLSITAATNEDQHDRKTEEARLFQAVEDGVAGLNHRWYATGSPRRAATGAPTTFTRCRIHFVPRILGEPEVRAGEQIHFTIQLSPFPLPRTRWVTGTEVFELVTGNAFEHDVPPDARCRITVRNLKSRIEQYHGTTTTDLGARIALVREIKTGARAFHEVEPEIDETWSMDTVSIGTAPLPPEKARIEEAIRRYCDAREDDFSRRLALLDAVEAQVASFRVGDLLKRGWRATRYTLEIDAALTTHDDLPDDAHGARLNALDAVQRQCVDFIARTRMLNRLFHRRAHGLLPAVEALEQRARISMGETALAQGIAVMRPRLSAKRVELGLLRAMGALAERAMAVEASLVAEENSVTLRVEYRHAAEAPTALRDAIATYFPRMLGIDTTCGNLSPEALLPLVRLVFPVDGNLHSLD